MSTTPRWLFSTSLLALTTLVYPAHSTAPLPGRAQPAPAAPATSPPARLDPAASDGIRIGQCLIEMWDPGEPAGPRFLLSGTRLAAAFETDLIRWLVRAPSTPGESAGSSRVSLRPLGCHPDVTPRGEQPLPGVVSWFHGPPEHWKTARRTWRGLRYPQLWDGIDLLIKASGDLVESTYRLAPGARPSAVRWLCRGAESVSVNDEGDLVIDTASGSIVEAAPHAWQTQHGARREIPARFEVTRRTDGALEIGYVLGPHDPSLPLLIDPAVVVQAGFLGGSGEDEALAVALDANDNLYVSGWANSDESTFPATVGPILTYTPTWPPWGDAFVAKLDPTGNTLIYAGYIGGWDLDFGSAIAVDTSGRAYVAGHTESKETSGFPVLGGPDLTQNGGMDGWIARVSADGTGLEYCGFVGGFGGEDRIFAVDVDSAGRATIAGRASSNQSTFPVTVGPDLSFGGATDAFVARLASDGLSYDYCGYIGGTAYEDADCVVVDDAGNAWVAGITGSDENSFPVSGGPDLTFNGVQDGFVARVATDGTSLTWCGYVGGSDSEFVAGLARKTSGELCLAGTTYSLDFPQLVGPPGTPTGNADGFLSWLSADGSNLLSSGVIAGSGYDWLNGLALDDAGGAWVVGSTTTSETDAVPLPLTGDLDTSYNGNGDGWVARVLPSGAGLDFCGYVGGDQSDTLLGVVVLPSSSTPGVREAWAVGHTASTQATLPVTTAFDVTQNGSEDALIVRVQSAPDPWTDLGFALAGSFGDPTNVGSGTFGPYSPLSITLDNALGNTSAFFCFGWSTLYAPLKGGVLVPDLSPPGFFVPLMTDGLGRVVITGSMPPGAPPGVSIYTQWWIADHAGPMAFAASNGLSGTTP